MDHEPRSLGTHIFGRTIELHHAEALGPRFITPEERERRNKLYAHIGSTLDTQLKFGNQQKTTNKSTLA